MKKIYENPTLQEMTFSAKDVLTLSFQTRGFGSIIDWEDDGLAMENEQLV